MTSTENRENWPRCQSTRTLRRFDPKTDAVAETWGRVIGRCLTYGYSLADEACRLEAQSNEVDGMAT